jgi:hypothetical protein
MQTPSLDALVDKITLTSLLAVKRTAAVAGVGQAEKVLAAMPQSVCAMVTPIEISTGKTLDLKIQGRRLSTDAWTDLQTVPQQVAGATTPLRYNLPSYPRYRVFETVAGTAFGAGETVTYEVTLVGTDVMNAPITQV